MEAPSRLADLPAIPANRSTPGLQLHKHKQSYMLIILPDSKCGPFKGVRRVSFLMAHLETRVVNELTRGSSGIAAHCSSGGQL